MIGKVWWSARLAWWYGLWRLRPSGRLFLARSGSASMAVGLRSVWHWVFANIYTVAFKIGLFSLGLYGLLPWPLTELDVSLILVGTVTAILFGLYHLATSGGQISSSLMRFWICRAVFGWKLGWSLRSRWPMEWAIAAAKTRPVQAEVGSSSETAVVIRQVFDAPKLSWWPQIEWPAISWWVSPPPGRTFEQFEAVLDVLASNIPNAVGIELEYERATSSIGRLSILFDDPLAGPIHPNYHNTLEGGIGQVVDLDKLRPHYRPGQEGVS
ncbi:MAG: hypothetical protein AAGA65_27490 [Actinomycetota bacterium]